MVDIQIAITDKRPQVIGAPVIVCGNSDYTLTFSFDAGWDAVGAKTARFVYIRDGAVMYEDVAFTGATVAVPILTNIREVRVGVYAGDLHTSTPVVIPCECSIRCGTGAPADPTPSQYDQILALLQQNNAAIAGIQIGGRNYIRNSAFAQGSTGWTIDAGSVIDKERTFNGHPSLKVELTGQTSSVYDGATTYNLPNNRSLNVQAGETWTLSAWYYAESIEPFDAGLGLTIRGRNVSGELTTFGEIRIQPSQITVGRWAQIKTTAAANADYSGCLVQAWVQRNGLVWFADLKLERGNTLTDWSPAPEDFTALEERVAALEASLLAMGGEI